MNIAARTNRPATSRGAAPVKRARRSRITAAGKTAETPEKTVPADIVAMLCKALQDGETLTSAAARVGRGRRTIWRRTKEDPDFAGILEEARQVGRLKRADDIGQALYAAAAIFALKNLDPQHWRDRYEKDVNLHQSGRMTWEELVGAQAKDGEEEGQGPGDHKDSDEH